MKIKLKFLGLVVILVISIVSCNKSGFVKKVSPSSLEKLGISLKDFISNVESKEEIAFFKT